MICKWNISINISHHFFIRERVCLEKVNMEREKAHLEFSVLVHGSYCKTDDSGDHDQDRAAAVPCAYHEITDDVDVPVLTCNSDKSWMWFNEKYNKIIENNRLSSLANFQMISL